MSRHSLAAESVSQSHVESVDDVDRIRRGQITPIAREVAGDDTESFDELLTAKELLRRARSSQEPVTFIIDAPSGHAPISAMQGSISIGPEGVRASRRGDATAPLGAVYTGFVRELEESRLAMLRGKTPENRIDPKAPAVPIERLILEMRIPAMKQKLSILDRIRQALAPKERFQDTIQVHTTSDGTQYVLLKDVLPRESARTGEARAAKIAPSRKSPGKIK